MFGLSFGELLIIAVLALLLLGPDRLPSAAKSAGKVLRDLRKVTEDLKDQVETELYADDRRAKPALVPPAGAAPVPPPAGAPPAATAENVPGLEAALVDAPSAPPAAAPASEPPRPQAPPAAEPSRTS